MLGTWSRLAERAEAADAWVRKAGAEHEHVPRLPACVAELRASRALAHPPVMGAACRTD